MFSIANTAQVGISNCSATGYTKSGGAAFVFANCNYVTLTGTNTARTSAYALYMNNSFIEFNSNSKINYNNIGSV